MKTICTQCKSDKIFIVTKEQEEYNQVQTMDDWRDKRMTMTLEYKPTVMRCGNCGYEVSK